MSLFRVTASNYRRDINVAKVDYIKRMRRAAHVATDEASRDALQRIRAKMASRGLGKLGFGVGQSSSLKKRRTAGAAWGVVFPKREKSTGGRYGRTAGAIEAYSRGAVITPRGGRQWLAFPTGILPKRAGGRGRRMTPRLYRAGGYEQRIGKLIFRPISARMALLTVKRVSLSPKTGRARRAGPGRTRTRVFQKEAVAFVLIRVTQRNRRFDEKALVREAARRLPKILRREMSGQAR